MKRPNLYRQLDQALHAAKSIDDEFGNMSSSEILRAALKRMKLKVKSMQMLHITLDGQQFGGLKFEVRDEKGRVLYGLFEEETWLVYLGARQRNFSEYT